MSNHWSYSADEQSKNLVSPEQVGHEISLSGKFSWRGKYGPFIRSGEDDEWVYLKNLDPRGQQDPKLHEGDLVTITAELQLSPGGRIVKVGKRMKLVWTPGYKWTGRKEAAIPLEHYYFDARQMKIESVKSP